MTCTGESFRLPGLILGLAVLCASFAVLPATASPGRVVRGYFWDEPMLEELRQWADVWAVLRDRSVVVKVDEAGERRMIDAGFHVVLDERLTDEVNHPVRLGKGRELNTPGFECYRTVEELIATGEALASAHPTLASYIDIGDSYLKTQNAAEGFDLKVLILTNSALAGPKPKIMMLGSIHPRELATPELVLLFGEHLLAGYGTDPDLTWLLDHHEVHLLVVANPDGRKRLDSGGGGVRKNLRPNACPIPLLFGTDLNRGYDFQWGCCGGSSGFGCAGNYRGTMPAAEPENQAIQSHLQAIFPDQRGVGLTTPADPDTTGLLLDFHSFGGAVLSPWGFTAALAPDNAKLQTLGRKYSWFVDYTPEVGGFSITDGTSMDYGYGVLGVPSYVIETGTSWSPTCDVLEHLLLEDQLSAMTWAAKIVRTSYITPSGPDALEVAVSPATVLAGTPVALNARIDDTRFQNANGVEPTQEILTAEYTVDVPPWDALATPSALVASDGSFDAETEAVEATIDTTGLGPGRHIVYLRGQDASGTWGSVGSAFLDVAALGTSKISGIVLDAQTELPLEATVRAGLSETTSDPVTGAYSLLVIPGSHEVVAERPTHAPARVLHVVVPNGGVSGIQLRLPPYTEIFFDDVESGDGGWTAQPPWAITANAAYSGTHSWTDSPAGNYSLGVDLSLTSPSFDLSGMAGTVLSFFHLYDITSGWDMGWVEVSANGGSWETVDGFSRAGFDTEWSPVEVAMPQLDGVADARVRVRLVTVGFAAADGWHIDDILVRAFPKGLGSEIFVDGFESGDLSAWSTAVP